MIAFCPRVDPGWLELRESADAEARSLHLVAEVRRRLPSPSSLLIHDLGCGTGGMGRWLAPLLPGRQHWVLYDHDPDLLALAAIGLPGPAADGSAVTVETRLGDVTGLDEDDLAGATLVTASALLDLLTEEELARLIRVCAGPGCPVLLTLSVTGGVRLTPPDRLDVPLAAAFRAHQRRLTPRGRLLGPEAVEAAVKGFRQLGAEVMVRASPWRLGPRRRQLTAAWLAGWVDAACEQDPDLAAGAAAYRRRLREAAAGRLAVVVDHADLLVLP